MLKETHTLELRYKSYYISLDKYTNDKDSIVVKFEDTGLQFAGWELNDFGSLTIKHNQINLDKYTDKYNIKFIIEYEPSPLPMALTEIDSIEGLKKNVTDLKSLYHICSLRQVANRKFGITLNEFVLFNSVILDEFGQLTRLEYDNMERYNSCFGDFITMNEFRSKISNFSIVWGYIPMPDDVCPNCGRKWDLYNLKDSESGGDEIYHKDCYAFHLYDTKKAEFTYIASTVFSKFSLCAI
jgi:hypothetical protein